ncbi:MAG: toprim domain-containing protein, partial [Planctomycetota bacterium]
HEQHGTVARRIFAERHISPEMIDRFQLGTAVGGEHQWDGLVRTLQKRQLDLRPYLAAGLIGRRRSGDGFIDRFRNRLIFPIFDRIGRPIAFGARKIDPDDEPKYLNSAEHARFRKAATLYGFDLAQPEIRRTRTAIVTEGYTDVIACHQAGFTNVVATLGTALTREHGRQLQHLCDTVRLIFDGDEAGQKAADRAVEVFFESDVDVQICVLPGGADPADLLNDNGEAGRQAFAEAIDSGVDAFDYLLRILRRDLEQVEGGVSGRQRVIEAFLGRLADLGFRRMGPLRRGLMLQRLSDLTSLSPEMLLKSMPQQRTGFRPAAAVVRGASGQAQVAGVGGVGARGGGPVPTGAFAAGSPAERAARGAGTPTTAGQRALTDVLAEYRRRAFARQAGGQSAGGRLIGQSDDPALIAMRGADRRRREARERAEAGIVGCLLQSRGLLSQCDTLPEDHPGRALDVSWFGSPPLRRLFEFVLSVSAASSGEGTGTGFDAAPADKRDDGHGSAADDQGRLLDVLEAWCPEEDADLLDLATELAHRTARDAGDDSAALLRLFAAYVDALIEYHQEDLRLAARHGGGVPYTERVGRVDDHRRRAQSAVASNSAAEQEGDDEGSRSQTGGESGPDEEDPFVDAPLDDFAGFVPTGGVYGDEVSDAVEAIIIPEEFRDRSRKTAATAATRGLNRDSAPSAVEPAGRSASEEEDDDHHPAGSERKRLAATHNTTQTAAAGDQVDSGSDGIADAANDRLSSFLERTRQLQEQGGKTRRRLPRSSR